MFAVSRDVEAMLIDKAWREEIRRRLDEINSGGVELIPWEVDSSGRCRDPAIDPKTQK